LVVPTVKLPGSISVNSIPSVLVNLGAGAMASCPGLGWTSAAARVAQPDRASAQQTARRVQNRPLANILMKRQVLTLLVADFGKKHHVKSAKRLAENDKRRA